MGKSNFGMDNMDQKEFCHGSKDFVIDKNYFVMDENNFVTGIKIILTEFCHGSERSVTTSSQAPFFQRKSLPSGCS